MASYGYLGNDVETGLFDKTTPSYEFAEKEVRLGFVRKVFGLLTLQLAITAGVTAVFCLSAPVKTFVWSNPWTFWTPFAASLALVIFLSFSETARRSHPTNLVVLLLFTACESVLVGISAMYDTQVVLLAATMTVGITACLTLYALQTKRDFTAAGGILFSLLFALIAAGLLSIFWHSKIVNIAISGIGAAVFACYIVFDVQLMIGGGAYSIEPDEYVFAAINIYLDIVNLFLYLLRLLQEIQGNN
jgi:FtsH-binding integral membrane protein